MTAVDTGLMVKSQLASYQKAINATINDYADRALRRTADEYTPYSHSALSAYISVLRRGGKRLRGALTMAGYGLAGGEDDRLALRAALAVELVHAYLLVIDDVADNSDMRRGGPSAHKILEAEHHNKDWKGDSRHFGEVMAVNAGLLGNHLAMHEFCTLPVDDSLKLEVVSMVNQIIVRTVHGQVNDLYNQVASESDEQTIIDTFSWKTAAYSIVNPLQVGAVLAGADSVDMAPLEPFGEKLGLAYQITDDIIGTFGAEQELGKSTRDDMCEGKMTLMVGRTLSRGSEEQKAAIQAALGNREASDAQFEAFRAAIEMSGALHYCQEMAEDLIVRSVRSLDELPLEWRQRPQWQFLRDLARFIQTRTK